MTMESALEAQGGRRAGTPTGLRRLTPSSLTVSRAAEGFAGLPNGVIVPGQLLAALKAVAPRIGVSSRLVHAVDWLFRFTQPQDWGRGGRPIVWPSSSVQQEALGLSLTQVKALNRALIEAGLITMKDSPNGKRYGRRDQQGRIVEAYGFDLSPIALRHAEFVQLAEEAKAERTEMGRLRRRATIARNGVTQILETVVEYGLEDEDWTRLAREVRDLARALRKVERLEEMAFGVEGLERRHRSARERLENLLSQPTHDIVEGVIPDPSGPENRPHQHTYKPASDPKQDTVIANEESSRTGGEARISPPVPRTQQTAETGRVLRLHADELVRLAPRLKPFLRRADPSWPDVVDAADWLRHDLDVSKSLWAEACLAMGREQAAIALAIVSTKDPQHFRTTPGGYFHGMVAKAKDGALHLDRTIWGMRQARRPEVSRAGQER
jgi:replication initiation protein RepC